jgi:hypothetical protein
MNSIKRRNFLQSAVPMTAGMGAPAGAQASPPRSPSAVGPDITRRDLRRAMGDEEKPWETVELRPFGAALTVEGLSR